MAALYVALAHLIARSATLARFIEGSPVVLIDRGRIDHDPRKRNKISEADLREALREHGIDGEANAGLVKVMTLEPSGKLSIVKFDPCKSDSPVE